MTVALELAAAGFAVFPLSPNSKAPLPGTRGFYDASRNPDAIRAAFSQPADLPPLNVGIYPHGSEPRLLIVDLDVKPGKDGRETLAVLEMAQGDLPATYTVETPSGGRHLYFALPPDCPPVASSAGRLGVGVDVRSYGGYVVARGSSIGGVPYAVTDDRPIALAPAWLIAAAGAAPEREAGADELAPGIGAWDLPANVRRAKDYINQEIIRGRVAIEGKGGNEFTYQTAAVVRDFGLSYEKTFELMAGAWNAACEPPWDECDLGQIIHNVYAYAKRPAGASRSASPDALEQMAKMAAERPKEAEAPKPPSRFRLLRWGDIMSMRPPTWIVEGTLPERGVIEIYGPYSSYKSFLALDMALSLAHGVEWAGRRVERRYNALYVAGEGAYGMRNRAASWAKAHELDSISSFALVPTMPLFGDGEDLSAFADEIRPFNPDLIVIDTTAHAMAGLDENAQKDAGTFMARVFEMRDALRTAVVLVHHTGKDVSRGSRGSTVIPAACDTIFAVEAPRPLQANLTMDKQKDAEAWKGAQGFQGSVVDTSLVFRPSQIAAPSGDAADALRVEAMISILEALRGATIETKPLAFEIAGIVNPHLDLPGKERLALAIKQWLNRVARDRGDLQRFLASKGTGRGETHIWRFPVEDGNDAGNTP